MFMSNSDSPSGHSSIHEVHHAGYTPLHLAVRGGDYFEVETLLSSGIDINALNNVKSTQAHQTALYLSCKHKRQKIAELLLSHGADLSIPDKRGWTPLTEAVFQSDGSLVSLLLKHGADPSSFSRGKSPIERTSNPRIINLLANTGRTSPNPKKSPRFHRRVHSEQIDNASSFETQLHLTLIEKMNSALKTEVKHGETKILKELQDIVNNSAKELFEQMGNRYDESLFLTFPPEDVTETQFQDFDLAIPSLKEITEPILLQKLKKELTSYVAGIQSSLTAKAVRDVKQRTEAMNRRLKASLELSLNKIRDEISDRGEISPFSAKISIQKIHEKSLSGEWDNDTMELM